jgi:hypothetical protein
VPKTPRLPVHHPLPFFPRFEYAGIRERDTSVRQPTAQQLIPLFKSLIGSKIVFKIDLMDLQWIARKI